MTYYPTLEEDLARAKEILDKGRAEVPKLEGLEGPLVIKLSGGTIFGADIYAAYRLLESFVAEIERLLALREQNHRIIKERELASAFIREVVEGVTGATDWKGSLADARQALSGAFDRLRDHSESYQLLLALLDADDYRAAVLRIRRLTDAARGRQ